MQPAVRAVGVSIRSRAAEFNRRSALYARLDTQLRDRTRFFAAAALVNRVFAQWFGAWPMVGGRHSFHFLDEVGAALETENLSYARNVPRRRPGIAWDHALVRAEQRLLQQHVRMHQARHPLRWEAIRSQLNHLLNDRYLMSVSRWCFFSGTIAGVLRLVRHRMRGDLDFAREAHRVCRIDPDRAHSPRSP